MRRAGAALQRSIWDVRFLQNAGSAGPCKVVLRKNGEHISYYRMRAAFSSPSDLIGADNNISELRIVMSDLQFHRLSIGRGVGSAVYPSHAICKASDSSVQEATRVYDTDSSFKYPGASLRKSAIH